MTLGQAPATARLAQRYLSGLAWGIAPALSFLAIRGFMGAVNRPEPGLWITLAAIPANAVLVYLLIHGEWGLPRLELFGAGLATTTINFAMFLAGLWFAHDRRPFRKYQVLGHIWRIDWMLMRQLIVIGAPISISFLLEYGLFAAAALLMGLISTTALAAHQIALQVDRHPVHGAVRHRDGGHRAGRTCRRPRRRRGGQTRGLCRDAARNCPRVHADAGGDPCAICDRAVLLRRGVWRAGASSSNSPRRF